MPTYFAIFVLPIVGFSAIFFLWFSASTRKTKIAFETLMATPEQIVDFWRPGTDGDGYSRLNVRTASGAILVIGHFEADDAEKRLHAASVKRALLPLKSA